MRQLHLDPNGWLARYDEGFDETSVVRLAGGLGLLWASTSPGCTILVGYDSRRDSREFAHLSAGVLASFGLDVVVSEVPCPLPALSWEAARRVNCTGAVMVTGGEASCEYGGVLVRGADGGPLAQALVEEADALISSTPSFDLGDIRTDDFIEGYLLALRSRIDQGRVLSSRLRVVVDPMYGPGRGVLSGLLHSLGCDVREIHAKDSEALGGIHPRACEPWVDDCEAAVVETSADLGIVLNGDCSRCAIVDSGGSLVSPHHMVPLVLEHLVRDRGQRGRVVGTLSCSARLERQAHRLGCPLTLVPVGFQRIYEEEREGDVLLGAEEYGGMAFPSFLPSRDGLLAALYLVEMVAMRRIGVRDLVMEQVEKIGRMDYRRKDLRLEPAAVQSFRNVLPGLNPREVCGETPCEVSHADGLRLKFADDSWLSIRPSRTSSVVRVCAEACSASRGDELLEAACEIARSGIASME